MPIINCKVELKLKWAKYCVQLVQVIIMVIQMIMVMVILFLLSKLYVPVLTLSEIDNQNLSKLLSKGLVYWIRSVYCNKFETKSESKNTTN